MLTRAGSVAASGYSRWLIPPAALAVHLSIGQAYAWSVFKPPLEATLGLTGTQSALPFQVAIVMLGLSAALGGALVEERGPRWAMAVAAAAWSLGFAVAALGVWSGQFWLLVLGYGGIGGVGLGIGYISPVSTLIRWFPDRPGFATGIAIMGFGGGALIASPWSNRMLELFGRDAAGIASAFLVHAVAYAALMCLGVVLIRIPPPGFRPAGWTPRMRDGVSSVGPAVSARNAVRTPQFWLLWVVLCLNVTAGIGILEKAAPMIRDFFAGTEAAVGTATAAGFVALLSAANMLGRILWSSTSDLVGRKNIYRLYLGVGACVYLSLAIVGNASRPLFILSTMAILTFYGGGFASVPAYLKDLFGTVQVGAIHGRLLTAWSAAGVLGPLIINSIADAQAAAGRSGPALYTTSLYTMMGLLLVGFVANELVRPVAARYHEPVEAAPDAHDGELSSDDVPRPQDRQLGVRMVLSWACVVVPFAYGLYELALRMLKLFV